MAAHLETPDRNWPGILRQKKVMEINWNLVKMSNGNKYDERYVDTPTGKGESFVNKGRKMVIVLKHIRTDLIEKKIRGDMTRCWQYFFNADIYTDDGRVISCNIDRTLSTERYVLPNGSILTNKWQVYDNIK